MATTRGDVVSPFRLVHAGARNAGLADAALSDLGRSGDRTSRHWSLGTSRPELDIRRQRLDRGQFRPVAAVRLRVQRAIQTADAHANNGRSYWDGG